MLVEAPSLLITDDDADFVVKNFGVRRDNITGRISESLDPNVASLEETGLNRFMGGFNQQDELYGGTGLDFLFGNGAPLGSPDRLYRRDGTPFSQLDEGLSGDAWKEYAKDTGFVWYYSGTNLEDEIHVDFVTEPGLLSGRHLITRRTSNQDNSTFDAQIRHDSLPCSHFFRDHPSTGRRCGRIGFGGCILW